MRRVFHCCRGGPPRVASTAPNLDVCGVTFGKRPTFLFFAFFFSFCTRPCLLKCGGVGDGASGNGRRRFARVWGNVVVANLKWNAGAARTGGAAWWAAVAARSHGGAQTSAAGRRHQYRSRSGVYRSCVSVYIDDQSTQFSYPMSMRVI